MARRKIKYKKHLQGRLVKMVRPRFKCSMMRRVTTKDRFQRWKEYAKDGMKMTKAKVNGMEFKNQMNHFWDEIGRQTYMLVHT